MQETPQEMPRTKKSRKPSNATEIAQKIVGWISKYTIYRATSARQPIPCLRSSVRTGRIAR